MPDSAPSLLAQSREPGSLQSRVRYEGGAYLINIGIVVLVGSSIATGGLFVYQRQSASSERAWRERIEEQKSAMRGADTAQLFDFSAELAVGKDLVQNHVYSSALFEFLRKNTHPRVQFLTFGFARANSTLELSGEAGSYQAIAEQVTIFESNPEVARVSFGGLSQKDGGRVSFNLALAFKPTLLLAGRAAAPSNASSTP